jgi:integrase
MLTDKFYPMFEKTTVPRFKWRSLRHYAISCWIAAGIKPKTIQAWVGHSTLAMTMDTYGHLFSNDDDFSKAGDAIGKGLFTP